MVKIEITARTFRMTRRKLCIVATVPVALNVFMLPHIRELQGDFRIWLVSNGVATEIDMQLSEHVNFFQVRFARKIRLFQDLKALYEIWRFLKSVKFDCVLSIMPKTGLLAMLGALLAGVPVRVHIFTGQVWANKTGFSRFILKSFDKVIVRCSTNVLADSPSQREFLIEEGVVSADRISVMAEGSICGVDSVRFAADASLRQSTRQFLNIPDEAIVYLFLGRLNHDKGVHILVAAFKALAAREIRAHLLVVGPDEEGFDDILVSLEQKFAGRMHRVGFTRTPEAYMCAADVFCLPSYREGFGSVVLEAASAGIPSVASRIYGLTDAVDDGVTGQLFTVGDIDALMNAMQRMASDALRRQQMGEAAKLRAISRFSQARVVAAFRAYLLRLLDGRKC